MYIRQRGHAGLGKWYESLLNVVGEAGGAVAEAYGGKGAGAAVRGLHKGWTQAAFNRGGKKGAAPAGGPGSQPYPDPQQPGPYPGPAYYPPPQPPAYPPQAQHGSFGGISPTVLAIGAVVVLGGGFLLMRSSS